MILCRSLCHDFEYKYIVKLHYVKIKHKYFSEIAIIYNE